MIRTLPDLKALESDDPKDAETAFEGGWRIDEDYWWVRPIREGDSDDEGDGFIEQRHVYFACAEDAVAFDGRASGPRS